MKVAERYSVKDNIVAAIICGLFLDTGRIATTERSQLSYRCAVRRQCERFRHEIIPEKSGFSGLYFNDQTLQRDGTLNNEEHLSLLNEPVGEFVCHAVDDGHKGHYTF